MAQNTNIVDLSSARFITPGLPADTEAPVYDMGDGDLEIEVDFGGVDEEAEDTPPEVAHGDNLAAYMDEDDLRVFGQELLADVDADKDTRAEWEEVFQRGLRLMGIKGSDSGDLDAETETLFEGASELFHPLVTEACVHFQAESLKAMLPPHGPAATKIVGVETPEKMQQAARVKSYLNYQTTNEIKGYFEEHDKLLMYLGKSGSAFKKITFNRTKQRIEVTYLPAEQVIVPYTARSMADAERIAHIESNISSNTMAHRIAEGLYLDLEITPQGERMNETQEVLDKQQGVQANTLPDKDYYEVVCVLVDTVVPGFESDRGGLSAPYIVHIERESGSVLGIYRNWREGDPVYERQDFFVHYPLVQSDGFYGYGFIHLLGQLASGASAALRQLLDAGTLSNLRGGFKRKGTRIDRDGEPFTPGEYRDVSVAGDRISDSIMQLNFQEPSNVLYQLMGFLVEAGRRMASLTDLNVGDGNQEAPVGTTIALLERGMNVMSAVHMRLCRAQKDELQIIARLCAEHLPEEYPYEVPGADRTIFKADFDDRVDIIPICDPRQFSQAQRIARAQNKLQLAQQFPKDVDTHEAVRDMMMEIDDSNIDRIVPPKQEAKPTDPIKENMNAIMGAPLKAFVEQNHKAHIQAHRAQLENPDLQDNQQMHAALMAHIQEHMAMDYQVQMMQILGVQDPAQLEQLPPEQLAVAAAQATAQITGQAQALAEAQARAAEPTFEQRMLEAEMQNDQAEIQRKARADANKLVVELAKIKQDDRDAELQAAADVASLQSQQRNADVQNFVSLVTALQNQNQREQQRDARTTVG
jgi:hypothetical protein